jgi:hypothetical protein
LVNSRGEISDYVAWGADPGADDDNATAAGEWTDGNYVDTSQIAENDTIGRDEFSTDSNSPGDWENGTGKADPFGVDATTATPGAQNVDVIIPEFDILAIPTFLLIIIVFYFNRNYKFNLNKKKKSEEKKGKKNQKKIGSQNG